MYLLSSLWIAKEPRFLQADRENSEQTKTRSAPVIYAPGSNPAIGETAHDCMMLHCTEPFIIPFTSSKYDLNNVERNIKTISSSSSSSSSSSDQAVWICRLI